MKKTLKKLASLIIAFSFLLNTTTSLDRAWSLTVAIPNVQDNLATASGFDDLTGIEHKDIANITFALQTNLLNLRKGVIDSKSLKEDLLLKERTIFNPADMHFVFSGDGMKTLPNGYVSVKCKVKNTGKVLRIYYVVFSTTKQDEGFPMEVYTEKEWGKLQKIIGSSDNLLKRSSEKLRDAKAIERYIQTGESIDEIIEYAFANNLTTEPPEIVFNFKQDLPELLDELNAEISNPDGLISIEDRKVYAINTERLPAEMQETLKKVTLVDEKGNEFTVSCSSHASNNAIYVFMPDEITFSVIQGRWSQPIGMLARGMGLFTFKLGIIHELGVICGLPVERVNFSDKETPESYMANNELDRRFREVRNKHKKPSDFEKLNLSIANLDTNLLTRDYAASENETKLTPSDRNVFRDKYSNLKQLLIDDIGQLLMKYRSNKEMMEAELKDDKSWLTKADLEAQKILVDFIRSNFRGHAIIAEEMFSGKSSEELAATMKEIERSEYAWVIDPIDGTQPFKEGGNQYAVGICLLRKGIPIFSFVYAPEFDIDGKGYSLFEANEWTEGAYLNGQRINATEVPTNTSVFIYNSPHLPFEEYQNIIEKNFDATISQEFTSSILRTCRIASGEQYDFHVLHTRPHPKIWDIIQASYILVKAGGKVIDSDGNDIFPFDMKSLQTFQSGEPRMPNVIMANRIVAEKYIEAITQEEGKLPGANKDAAQELYIKTVLEEKVVLAQEVGIEISRPILEKNYTLVTCDDFYKNEKEYKEDILKYGSIFNLKRIKPASPEVVITRILDLIQGEGLDPNGVIVQLPKVFGDEDMRGEIERLVNSAPGLKFMIIDTQGLKEEDNSSEYRKNIYSMMLLARHIDKDTFQASKIHMLLRFLIGSIVGEDNKGLISGYIDALVHNDITSLIKTVLKYKPTEKYDVREEYHNIAKTLIAA